MATTELKFWMAIKWAEWQDSIRSYSTIDVRTAMMIIPDASESICFNDSFGFSSWSSSGNTVTNAICRKPPAVNGKIHDVLASVHRKQVNKLSENK